MSSVLSLENILCNSILSIIYILRKKSINHTNNTYVRHDTAIRQLIVGNTIVNYQNSCARHQRELSLTRITRYDRDLAHDLEPITNDRRLIAQITRNYFAQ